MDANPAHKNGPDAGATAVEANENHPATKQGMDSAVSLPNFPVPAEAVVGVMPASVQDIGFETDTPGLFVHYEPLREWPGVPKIDSAKPVEVSTFEKVFSDGTIERIVNIEAGPTELTYESVHLLIDFLQEAARSLVAARDGE